MILQFCDWLAATPLSKEFQTLKWFVPLIQTAHILCVAVVMTSVGVLDFKMMGITGRAQSLAAMVSRAMPWVWKALALLLATGTLLTITEPARELMNIGFRLKMPMVAAMAALLVLVQRRLRDDPQYWHRSRRRRAAARTIGGVSLLLAVSIGVAGRWIAYLL